MIRSVIISIFCLLPTLVAAPVQAAQQNAALQASSADSATMSISSLPLSSPVRLMRESDGNDESVQLAQTTPSGPRSLGAVGSAVQVPSLQCLSVAEAQTILGERRLSLGQVHNRPSSACPDGGIIAQSPPRGTTVRPGTPIEVVISGTTGAPTQTAPTGGSTVPDVAGLTPAEAQSLLRREGLDIGQIQRESAAAPLGTIIAQTPAAGSSAQRGSRVNLTVASEVRIPDLRNLTQQQAEDTLRESSLAIGRVSEENSTQPNGTIIKQWPLPGVPAAANDQVDITIAKGLSVPDLRTLSLDDARTRLRQAGLRPGKVESRVSDQLRGTIIEQRPAANTVAGPDVVVDVVLAATPTVPDLTGRTLDEARGLIEGQLMQVGSVTSRVSEEPQGTIIEQQPSAGAEGTAGSTVDLVLAEGLEVPELVGLSLEDAGAMLAEQLMRLGEVTRQTTPDGDGTIIDQSPAAGQPAAFGVGINVTVSQPPTVPDLLGLTPEAVADRLAEQQLELSTVDYQLAPGQQDQTVLSQDPPAGSAIDSGGSVSVVMAVTSAPADRPDLVIVPGLLNMTGTQARQAVEAAGLGFELDGSVDDQRPNRITGQTPAAGRLVASGNTVVAQVESIDEVMVPDLLGVVRETVDTRLSDAYLELGEQDWRLSTQPDGTVINQDPPPGTPVAYGNAVDVVFSASALIPDLTGLTPEEANPVLISQSLQLGHISEAFSLRWPGTIVHQTPEPDSPARPDSVVEVEVVGLAGPLTAGGTLLLALAGVVWFRARQSTGGSGSTGGGGGRTPMPPPVYGIAKSAAARPAFEKTARAARPRPTAAPAAAMRSEPDYIVTADPGTQAIQTDAESIAKPAIRFRGRTDPGEQTLAIEKS